MTIRFLIVVTYYRPFLHYFYTKNPEVASWNYEDQIHSLLDECFGSADFYSKNLRKLGHEAAEVIVNNEILQKCWARENGLEIDGLGEGVSLLNTGRQGAYQRIATMLSKFRPQEGSRRYHILKAGLTPFRRFARKILMPPSDKAWLERVLAAQVRAYRPDVLYVMDITFLSSQFLAEIKPYVKFILGWCACPIPDALNLEHYNLIVSAAPHYISRFRSLGVPSEYLKLAFESSILERLPDKPARSGVAFVGQYDPSTQWSRRAELLEALCADFDLDCWGFGVEKLSAGSPIRRCYRGQAWGLHMFKILQLSKIGLNIHGEVAGNFAGNGRMFETTGVGALLVTDMKDNLHEFFELDKEVVAFNSPEDCLEKVHYLLDHEDERAAIAKAGQERTLREHTYYHRMQELIDIIKKYL